MAPACLQTLLDEKDELRLLRFGVRKVAEHLGVSERTLRRRYERQGIRLRDHLRLRRRELAVDLLGGDLPVRTLSSRLGFSSPQTFARFVRREFGDTPTGLRLRLRAAGLDARLT